MKGIAGTSEGSGLRVPTQTEDTIPQREDTSTPSPCTKGSLLAPLMLETENSRISIRLNTPHIPCKHSKEIPPPIHARLNREKDIMIFSCVRAPEEGCSKQDSESSDGHRGGVGFLDDWRRLNVAITRAKHAMWIIGHAGVLKQSNEWRELINDSRERAAFVDHSIPSSINSSAYNEGQGRATERGRDQQQQFAPVNGGQARVSGAGYSRRLGSGGIQQPLNTVNSSRRAAGGTYYSSRAGSTRGHQTLSRSTSTSGGQAERTDYSRRLGSRPPQHPCSTPQPIACFSSSVSQRVPRQPPQYPRPAPPPGESK